MSVPQYVGLVEFPGYEVGTDGSVWSYWKPRGVLAEIPWQMKPSVRPDGYTHVPLRKNGKKYNRLVHRLILEAFIGPCPPGMECRHYPDRSKINCALNNLSWATHQVNADDQVKHGTRVRGTKDGASKLTPADIPVIRQLIADGVARAKIARQFNVSSRSIEHIGTGYRWGWVP